MTTAIKQQTLSKPTTKQPWTLRLGKLNKDDEIIEGGEKWRIGSFQHWGRVAITNGRAGKMVFYRLQYQPLYLELIHYQGAAEHRQKVTMESNTNDSDKLELWFVCACGNKVKELRLDNRKQTWRCPEHGTK